MKPNQNYDITRESTFVGEEVAFSLDENSLAHLMSVLTDLYSDPVAAVIREYFTNARDSHVAAGVDAPVEVWLPNDLNPVFKVVDHGTGMNVDDLTQVYTKYGYSTKRHTDAEAGMLGLGCKSALTFASQFTVVAVKDGVRAVAVVSRQEDGTATLRIVDTVATDEANGVEIQIPVPKSQVTTFSNRAEHLFRFVRSGVLVNGKAPEPFQGAWLDPDVVLTSEVDRDYVVMGDVAYPVERYQFDLFPYDYNQHIVAWLPMGVVNFPTSREGLSYTALTKDSLKTIKKFVNERYQQAIRDDVANSESYFDALKKVNRDLRRWLQLGLRYRGQEVPVTFAHTPVGEEVEVTDEEGKTITITRSRVPSLLRHQPGRSGRVRMTEAQRSVAVPDVLDATIIVENYPNRTLTSKAREQLNRWADSNNLSLQRKVTLLLPDTLDDLSGGWASADDLEARVIDYSVLDAVVLPRPTRTKAEVSERPDYYRATGTDHLSGLVTQPLSAKDIQDHLDAGGKVAFFSPSEGVWVDRFVAVSRLAKVLGHDLLVVRLNANRNDKFARDFEGSKHLSEVYVDLVAQVKEEVTDDDRLVLKYKSEERALRQHERTFRLLSETDDPAFQDYLDALDALSKKAEAPSPLVTAVEYVKGIQYRFWNSPVDDDEVVVDLTTVTLPSPGEVLQDYPMLRVVTQAGYSLDYTLKHTEGAKDVIFDYINTLYSLTDNNKEA